MDDFPHMCRDGHPKIGHSTDGERCPVCIERDRAEQAEADARGWADSFKQAEAALDSFLGPDGGKTVVELRAAIERLERDEPAYRCEDCAITRRISELTSGCPMCGETMVPAGTLPLADCPHCGGTGRRGVVPCP